MHVLSYVMPCTTCWHGLVNVNICELIHLVYFMCALCSCMTSTYLMLHPLICHDCVCVHLDCNCGFHVHFKWSVLCMSCANIEKIIILCLKIYRILFLKIIDSRQPKRPMWVIVVLLPLASREKRAILHIG
jgi:hypothetical protein